MKHYIIDGNNLIGRIQLLKQLQKKDKQASREKLALMIERYFDRKNVKVSLHFDGYPKDKIKISKGSICYSYNLTADEMIKKEIDKSDNSRNIVVVTSDLNLKEYARTCSCTVLSAEEFEIHKTSYAASEDEENKIRELQSSDEFKKLFGVK